jgi:hypothetical protein
MLAPFCDIVSNNELYFLEIEKLNGFSDMLTHKKLKAVLVQDICHILKTAWANCREKITSTESMRSPYCPQMNEE